MVTALYDVRQLSYICLTGVPAMPKQSLTVRLPDDLVRIVRNRAENEGLSQAEVVERSLRRDLLGAAEPGLDAEEWQQWRPFCRETLRDCLGCSEASR